MNDQQPSGEDLDPVPQESNPAAEPIVDAELQDYVRRTLKLVGCLL